MSKMILARAAVASPPSSGALGVRDTLGRPLARVASRPTPTTTHPYPLCGVGCSDTAGLNSCHPEAPGVDEFTRPSDGLSEGLTPTERE